MSIDPGSYGHFGYRAVEVTLTTLKGAAADRQITIQFNAGDYSNRGKGMTTEQQFVMPAGATSVGTRLIVPQYQVWQTCGWKVLVDNHLDDQLSIDMLGLPMTNPAGSGAGAPDVVFATAMSGAKVSQITTDLQTGYNGPAVQVYQIAEADLPTEWIEYTTGDVVILPADQLAVLMTNFPQQATAMLRWVRAGGNLWLIDAGRMWQQLTGVNAALDGTKIESEQRTLGGLAKGWKYAPLGERSVEPVEGALLLSGFKTDEVAPADKALAWVQNAVSLSPKTSQQSFAVRGYGLGVIAAFRGSVNDSGGATAARLAAMAAAASQQPGMAPASAGTSTSANYELTQSLLGPRVTWATRHGMQPDSANPEFNNLLIPNVGVAPVGQFQFLITVFVLVIGPLNYWLLKRNKKLPLLLATVPAAAACTTLLLFAYGIIVDGFAVRARSRTLTLLDQRSGEAVAWGRLSYYAGIAPREGMTVPKDQAMFPIYPTWEAESSYGGLARMPRRGLTWDDQQRLTKSWLQSRTPTQYLAMAARPSKKRLELRTTPEGLRVVNRLGVDVTHLAVQDNDGKFYWCENLADEKGVILPAAKQSDIAPRMRRLFTDNLPEFPSGDDGNSRGNNYGFQLSQNLMEGRLEAINSPQINGWGNGKYIAFTSRPIELDLGVAAEEEACFNVVEGTW